MTEIGRIDVRRWLWQRNENHRCNERAKQQLKRGHPRVQIPHVHFAALQMLLFVDVGQCLRHETKRQHRNPNRSVERRARRRVFGRLQKLWQNSNGNTTEHHKQAQIMCPFVTRAKEDHRCNDIHRNDDLSQTDIDRTTQIRCRKSSFSKIKTKTKILKIKTIIHEPNLKFTN